MRLDALIFGGGAAGLWLLDRLSRDGHHVLLLEAHSLGFGQTVASHGIIHGGLKYTLAGHSTKSAQNSREVCEAWRDSLLGKSTPNLSKTRLRSGCCYLWQKDSVASRTSATSGRFGLQVKPEVISADERPAAFQGVFGTVARLHELVIAPRSFVQDLASQYHDRILQIDAKRGLELELDSPGEVSCVRLTSPSDRSVLELHPRQVIFTAGTGNARLRKLAGLSTDVMQLRPSHLVLVRGDLPELNGHCFDGAKARVTITSEMDSRNRMVWQIGGQVAEESVKLSQPALAERVRSELCQVLPGVNLHDVEWSTSKINRAEGATANGSKPENIQVLCAGNVTTGWPTKLVLAPVLAQEVANRASSPYHPSAFDTTPFVDWPRPEIAVVPWEEEDRQWWTLDDTISVPFLRAA